MGIDTELLNLNRLSSALCKRSFVKSIQSLQCSHTIFFVVEFTKTIAVFTLEYGVWSWYIHSPKLISSTLKTRDLVRLVEDFEQFLQDDELRYPEKFVFLNILTEFVNELPPIEKICDQLPLSTQSTDHKMIYKFLKDNQDIPLYPKE
jgi:hypothetical protein